MIERKRYQILIVIFLIVLINLAFTRNLSAKSLKIKADKLTALSGCIYNPESGYLEQASDGTSAIIQDSIDFGDGLLFNQIEACISLTYGEIYGQHTGELDFYVDNEVVPFASVRVRLPVKWDSCYTIAQCFKKIAGKHQVKIVWDWYTANLKNIVFSYAKQEPASAEHEIRIACLGNSITEGTDAGDRINNGYVGILGQMLGNGYQVRNYGSSGATVCRKTYNSFSSGTFCPSALAFKPDIVTIALGTNDSQTSVWNMGNFAANFESDYIYLIDLFAKLESHPKIYLCLPPPIFPNTNWSHQPTVLANEIIPRIKKIAKEKGLEVIDFYTPMLDHNDYYAPSDQLHPLVLGHQLMAKLVFEKLRIKH